MIGEAKRGSSRMTKIVSRADDMRGLCAVVTKVARADLQTRLDSYEAGISAIEHGVLRHLSHGVSAMADISRLMGISPSTLVYVVDGLVKKKLVKRRRDPSDRRREPLSLEKRGVELFARIPKMDDKSAMVQSLLRLSEGQQCRLIDLLSRFVSGLPGAAQFYKQDLWLPKTQSGKQSRTGATGIGRHGRRRR
jgi:DNA-binding MarR family transcriptional regulator